MSTSFLSGAFRETSTLFVADAYCTILVSFPNGTFHEILTLFQNDCDGGIHLLSCCDDASYLSYHDRKNDCNPVKNCDGTSDYDGGIHL
mmetsp:Transcript_16187/g.26194  ORF Transcript_16187/g.26194 Transcript_16187/m.26194 type:complete len:89 (+) Transcript_16187:456-722(+)